MLRYFTNLDRARYRAAREETLAIPVAGRISAKTAIGIYAINTQLASKLVYKTSNQ